MKKQYPKVGVGAVVIYNSMVLLVQRGTQPYAGQWCIPGGKVNFGETLQQAAEREILEETGISIKAREPVFTFDVIDMDNPEGSIHYVVVDLRADYLSGELIAGSDALEASWFTKDRLAQSNVQHTTRNFLQRWWIES